MASTSGRNTSRVIVVVDDEPAICQVVGRMLEPLGYPSAAVHSSDDAIQLLARLDRSPALCVLDVRIAEDSGIALAREISHRHPAVPILFISGYPEALGERLPPGQWLFLPKPFSREELQAAARLLLGAKAERHSPGLARREG